MASHLPRFRLTSTNAAMSDREKNAGSGRERADQSRDQDGIIPERHGKHGGSEESEGAPQENAPEAPAPREPDDSRGMSR